MYSQLGSTGIGMYSFFGMVSYVALVIYNLFQIKRNNIVLGKLFESVRNFIFRYSKTKGLLFFAIVESLLISFFQNALVSPINAAFGDLVGTGANYFGLLFFGPLLWFLCFYFLGVNPFRKMDSITPAFSLALIFVKLGCFCSGCCSGMECSWGLYYPLKDAVMFPSQLVEAILALIIFLFLLKYKKSAKEGSLYPIFMMLYSGTRFFAEFFRIEENVFGIFKTYHILCLIGVVLGAVWLFIVIKFSDKILIVYKKAPFPWMKVSVSDYRKKKKKSKNSNNTKKNGVIVSTSKNRVGHPKIRMWVLIWSLGLMGQIGWNVESMWFNTFVYEKIDKNPSIITPMLILSALATTVSIFLLGTLSDRTGRRRTLISTGYIVWGVLTIVFGFNQLLVNKSYVLAIIGVVFGDMLVSFFGSMSTDVGYATWTTDIMNDDNKGKIGAAIAIQCVLGSLLGNVIGGYIVGQENNYMRLFIVVGSVLATFGVVSAYMFTNKDDVKPSIRGTFKQQFFSVFDFRNLLKQKELLWVNLSVIIFFIGFNTYFPHLGNYLIHYLGFSADKMGLIQAIPLVLAMIITLPVSNFVNKDKFVPVSVFAIASGIVGALFVYPITPDLIDTTSFFDIRLFLGVFFVGVSYVVMLQSTKIWTKKLYPSDSKGQYEGLWAISYVLLPMTFASIISQNVVKLSGLTIENSLTGQIEYIPNGNIFLIGVTISTLSVIPVIITKLIKRNKIKLDKVKK